MKRLIFIFALLLTVVAVKAAWAGDDDDPQFQRVITDTVMTTAVQANADKYGLKCQIPTKSSQINWLCQSTNDCRYSYSVPCYASSDNPLEQPVQKLDIRIFGRDNGVESQVQTVEIHFL